MAGRSLVPAAVGVVIGIAAALLLLFAGARFTTWGLGVNAQTGVPSLEPLEIHSHDQVHWVTTKGTVLFIETEQKIFAKSVLQPVTNRYRVVCAANVCDSKALLTTLPTMPKDGYKYWQGLGSPVTWYDGHIIIVKP